MTIATRDKTILITGATRGIGAQLLAHYRTRNNVIGISRGSADLSVPERIADLNVKCDVLINNAAVLTTTPLVMMREDALRDMVNVNLLAPILLTQKALRHMMRKKWGRIINISSMATRVCVPGDSVYAATKAGLETFTKVVNKEAHPFGVTVNAIGVSGIPTDMLNHATKNKPELVKPIIPHGEFATIGTIVGAIDYFCGPASDDIGGQTIYLGGIC